MARQIHRARKAISTAFWLQVSTVDIVCDLGQQEAEIKYGSGKVGTVALHRYMQPSVKWASPCKPARHVLLPRHWYSRCHLKVYSRNKLLPPFGYTDLSTVKEIRFFSVLNVVWALYNTPSCATSLGIELEIEMCCLMTTQQWSLASA